MKKEESKKLFAEQFIQTAPTNITTKVIQRIAPLKKTYDPLLPKSVLWAIIGSSSLLCLLAIITASSDLSIPTFNWSQILTNNMAIIILPFTIVSLVFIKTSVAYYKTKPIATLK